MMSDFVIFRHEFPPVAAYLSKVSQSLMRNGNIGFTRWKQGIFLYCILKEFLFNNRFQTVFGNLKKP